MILLRFSPGAGPLAWIVRQATWSWCAHVGFKSESGDVVDATPEFGVSARRTADEPGTRYFRVNATDARIRDALVFAGSQIGRPYDWTGCIGIGLHRDWHQEKSWFCSELVAWAFERAGCPLLRADHLDRVTPADLLMSPLLSPA